MHYYQICKDFLCATNHPVYGSDCTVGGQQVDVKDHIQLSRNLLWTPTR